MSIPRRFLQLAAEPPEPPAVDSDIVVILAALLCALICVVGLAFVARCAWLRRSSPNGPSPPPPPPNKGVKKKVLRQLPKLVFDHAFSPSSGGKLSTECPICLADFVEGDEIRILPQCGHGFHVWCVDTWLGSHSSCPSCRQILVASTSASSGASAAAADAAAAASTSRCQRCGASSGELDDGSAAASLEAGAKAREDGDAHRFLP